MSEPQVELNALKHEVAELWTRFRKEEPRVVDDEGRRALSEQTRSLELKRRHLADRRSVLRLQLEVARRRRSRIAPAVHFFGALAGLVVTFVAVLPFVPDVAELSLLLEPSHGAAVLSVSLVMLAFAMSGEG